MVFMCLLCKQQEYFYCVFLLLPFCLFVYGGGLFCFLISKQHSSRRTVILCLCFVLLYLAKKVTCCFCAVIQHIMRKQTNLADVHMLFLLKRFVHVRIWGDVINNAYCI